MIATEAARKRRRRKYGQRRLSKEAFGLDVEVENLFSSPPILWGFGFPRRLDFLGDREAASWPLEPVDLTLSSSQHHKSREMSWKIGKSTSCTRLHKRRSRARAAWSNDRNALPIPPADTRPVCPLILPRVLVARNQGVAAAVVLVVVPEPFARVHLALDHTDARPPPADRRRDDHQQRLCTARRWRPVPGQGAERSAQDHRQRWSRPQPT